MSTQYIATLLVIMLLHVPKGWINVRSIAQQTTQNTVGLFLLLNSLKMLWTAVFYIRYQGLSFLRPFSGVIFERCEMFCEMWKLASISWSFLTVKQLYFGGQNSVDLLIFSMHYSKRFWWHTAGENIDKHRGTSQQQRTGKQLLSSRLVLYELNRVKFSCKVRME